MAEKENNTGFRTVDIGFGEVDTPLDKYKDMAYNQRIRADHLNRRTPVGYGSAADADYNDDVKMLSQNDPHGHILVQQGIALAQPGTQNVAPVRVNFSPGFHEIPMLILLTRVLQASALGWTTQGCATSNGPNCMFTYYDLDQGGFVLVGGNNTLYHYDVDAAGFVQVYWTAVGV